MTITFTDGEVITQETGAPVALNGREIASLAIDSSDKVIGPGQGVTL